jgi:hypothetical protein
LRGLTGWERLLESTDTAERAVLRTVLERAIVEHDKRRDQLLKHIEVAVQRGVAQAFK